MVRAVQSFNQGIKGYVMAGGIKNSAKKAMELPAKVAMTAAVSYGIMNNIDGKGYIDTFIMKCSDHDPDSWDDCVTMSYSPVC